jgi:hypothetical protein
MRASISVLSFTFTLACAVFLGAGCAAPVEEEESEQGAAASSSCPEGKTEYECEMAELAKNSCAKYNDRLVSFTFGSSSAERRLVIKLDGTRERTFPDASKPLDASFMPRCLDQTGTKWSQFPEHCYVDMRVSATEECRCGRRVKFYGRDSYTDGCVSMPLPR